MHIQQVNFANAAHILTGYGFMTKFTAHIHLVSGIGSTGKDSHIRAADTGIKVLHQHIVITHFRKRQLPHLHLFFP